MARYINKIIIHCSDSEWGNRDVIRGWHLENGWDDIGYHYVIGNSFPTVESWRDHKPNKDWDGKVEPGRNEEVIGAHVKGYNSHSIGICLIGKRSFTGLQLRTLKKLLVDLQERHPNAEIVGHCELDDNKPYCPGIDMTLIRELPA